MKNIIYLFLILTSCTPLEFLKGSEKEIQLLEQLEEQQPSQA